MMWDWMAMPQVVQGLVSCYYERPFCLAAVEGSMSIAILTRGGKPPPQKKSDLLIHCGHVVFKVHKSYQSYQNMK